MSKISLMEIGAIEVYNNVDKTASVYMNGKFVSAIEWCTASSDLLYKLAKRIEFLEHQNDCLSDIIKNDFAKNGEVLNKLKESGEWNIYQYYY